jgi:hypothetical protein
MLVWQIMDPFYRQTKELEPRQVDVDILEVMRAGAADADAVHGDLPIPDCE